MNFNGSVEPMLFYCWHPARVTLLFIQQPIYTQQFLHYLLMSIDPMFVLCFSRISSNCNEKNNKFTFF